MVLCPVCPMYSIPAVTVILSPLTQFAAVKIHLKNSKSNNPMECYKHTTAMEFSCIYLSAINDPPHIDFPVSNKTKCGNSPVTLNCPLKMRD